MIAASARDCVQPPRNLRLWVWGLLCLAPLAAYAVPLWQNVLADTPIAYLVWIPVLAVLWGAFGIGTSPPAIDDAELDAILGVGLLVVVGTALVIGPARWPYLFVMESAGLLLWPLWLLGMAWLMFGVSVTSRLLAPLLYLVLCWPPILGFIASLTQGVLVHIAVGAITDVSRSVTWVQTQGQTGTFLVAHGSALVPVLISNACSGADSALGAAILLPLLLTQFSGAAWRKGLLVLFSLLGAVVFNLLRLAALIVALHTAGPAFALGVLHPILGLVLFAVLALCLLSAAGWIGLRLRDHPAFAMPVAGRSRLYASWVLSAVLFAALWPMFSTPFGAPGKPLPVRSSAVDTLLPRLPGVRAVGQQRYNDASILGPDSVSIAQTYVTTTGASVLAEIWATPNLGALESYGFNNCLMFHGEELSALQTFDVSARTAAADYALRLPPPVQGQTWVSYEDIEWQGAIRLPSGRVLYLRYALAALPQQAGLWPKELRRVLPPRASGLTAMAMPPSFGAWPRDLSSMQGPLERFAQAFAKAVVREDSTRATLAARVRRGQPSSEAHAPLAAGQQQVPFAATRRVRGRSRHPASSPLEV